MLSRLTIRMCAATLLVGVPAVGAVAQLPAKPENLQVLPKDMPTDTVVAVMRGFAMSLGVRCTFCHVERTPAGGPATAGAPGQPAPGGAPGAGPGGGGGPFANFDFKSDEKDHKKIARIMMRMVDS